MDDEEEEEEREPTHIIQPRIAICRFPLACWRALNGYDNCAYYYQYDFAWQLRRNYYQHDFA